MHFYYLFLHYDTYKYVLYLYISSFVLGVGEGEKLITLLSANPIKELSTNYTSGI